MEVQGGKDRKCTVMLCEMLGTALFVYAIILTDRAATIPISLFASILIFGGITGGHFNPAVTLAVYISEEDRAGTLSFMLLIWLGQFLGGALSLGMAFLSLYETVPPPTTVPDELIPRLCPIAYPEIYNGQDCDNWDNEMGYSFDYQVLANETICTFIFASVILMVKLKEDRIKLTHDGVSGAFAVALALMCITQTGIKLGACYNPIVAVALPVFAKIFLEEETDHLFHYVPFYIIGSLIGACLAGLFHLKHREILLEESEDEVVKEQL